MALQGGRERVVMRCVDGCPAMCRDVGRVGDDCRNARLETGNRVVTLGAGSDASRIIVLIHELGRVILLALLYRRMVGTSAHV